MLIWVTYAATQDFSEGERPIFQTEFSVFDQWFSEKLMSTDAAEPHFGKDLLVLPP